MKDSVIIITFDMIPNAKTWGGCQRMYFLAKYLNSQKLDVTVFSFEKSYKNMFGHEVEFNTISLKSKNKLRNILINGISDKSNKKVTNVKENQTNTKDKVKFKKIAKKIIDFIKPLDQMIYNEPQVMKGWISNGWIKEHYKYFCQFIEENNIKTVIISGPPFGLLSLGYKLKNKFGSNINLIVDYRDPWNLWKKGSFISENREKKILKAADIIVVTNEFYKIDLAKVYEIDLKKIRVIENGYSNEDWDKIAISNTIHSEKLKISFVGAIGLSNEESYRNCNKLFSAFEKLVNQYENVILEFVGVSNTNSQYVNMLKQKFKANILIKDPVSSSEAIQYMLNSDVLLLIHTTNDNSSKYLIGGKLYDYIRVQKPIFSIGSRQGIHHKVITDNKIGISVENDENEIYEGLIELYKQWEKEGLEGYNKIEKVEKFSREYQNEKYHQLIKNEEEVV